MILVGIGANLAIPYFGSPRATCGAALAAMERSGVRIVCCSRWYRTQPVPTSTQPWYVNAVALLGTRLPPSDLLALLLGLEARFGRSRRTRGEARVLDLDLLAFGDRISRPGEEPVLPHPRMHERAFVLVPLRDVAPDWKHPVIGLRAEDMITRFCGDQSIEPLSPSSGLFGTEWQKEPTKTA